MFGVRLGKAVDQLASDHAGDNPGFADLVGVQRFDGRSIAQRW